VERKSLLKRIHMEGLSNYLIVEDAKCITNGQPQSVMMFLDFDLKTSPIETNAQFF
jgi:hypothetical protein